MHLRDSSCCRRVYRSGEMTGSQCLGRVTTITGGKPYCAVHDPANVRKRDDANAARRRKAFDERDAARRRQEQCEIALTGIEDPQSFVECVKKLLDAATDENVERVEEMLWEHIYEIRKHLTPEKKEGASNGE